MDYKDFLDKMLANYARFDTFTNGASAGGLDLVTKTDGVITNQTGGAFVFLRPHPDIARRIGEVSHQMVEMLGEDSVMVYGEDIAHATMFVAKQGPGYNAGADEEFAGLDEKLDQVCQSVAKNPRKKMRLAANYAHGFVLNETTTILAGLPNIEFFEAAQGAVESASELYIKVNMPWGGHITASRFAKAESPGQMRRVAEFLRGEKFSTEQIPYVEVCAGHYRTEGLRFIIETTHRYSI